MTMEDASSSATTPLLKHASTETAMGDALWDAHDEVDAEFGGTVARRELEKKLLWKVDKRMSILVLIYILNFVSCRSMSFCCAYSPLWLCADRP